MRRGFFGRHFQKLVFVWGTRHARRLSVTMHDGGTRHVHHRGTPADRSVLKGIFKKRSYALDGLRRANELHDLYSSMVASGRRPLIVDAGANIGGSAVWFANRFPQAHIVAIEPDPANVALLKANTVGLNVDIREAAIGSTDGRVSLFDPGYGSCGFQTRASDAGEVACLSASRLIAEKVRDGYAPFLIKIDIEGGEETLFDSHCEWIESFPLLVIELHDWLFARAVKSANFLKAIAPLGRDFVYMGENVFSIRNSDSASR